MRQACAPITGFSGKTILFMHGISRCGDYLLPNFNVLPRWGYMARFVFGLCDRLVLIRGSALDIVEAVEQAFRILVPAARPRAVGLRAFPNFGETIRLGQRMIESLRKKLLRPIPPRPEGLDVGEQVAAFNHLDGQVADD